MQCIQAIKKDVYWIGGNDFFTERFENMLPLPNGVSYNSYLILDEKTAVIDSVDASIRVQFLANAKYLLQDRKLDYLVINHMEPDHCAALVDLVEMYPDVKIVGNAKIFTLFEQFYGKPCPDNYVTVGEGDVIDLGQHKLQSFKAPMVHWPEVTVTFEQTEKILFSADAFGTFGTLNGNIFADEVDYDTVYLADARRYYSNIVGKFGPQVQLALKKLLPLGIEMIAPLHGPIYRTPETIQYIVGKYNAWSSYEPEKKGVLIAFASMYGNTTAIVNVLANKLALRGITDMRMFDVSKTHPSFVVAEAWKYSHLVFAAPTYNLNLYLTMENFLHDLKCLHFQNRKFAVVGNHSWASAAKKRMVEYVTEYFKKSELIGDALDFKSSLKAEQEKELDALADAIAESVKA
ncbi:Anaerobic nitric oxide reductase flavorubredoxin [Sporomusa silvacetica DSM 10669]|uniref:Anaerobic nitric oxide reductase flavorubredoxin n=1 Tax=Sporomusa silvacetica DSM 10669 TaxID=1123289 RepID=A0ABZ3IKC1_9FIRM|nr:FprA family A-type flavoprotein [Sporomusa silvacetica]OZC13580.1 anaerobic nitric oxide reductase flavorubredoxin [Sporomusa silvacetica DSM 10669]